MGLSSRRWLTGLLAAALLAGLLVLPAPAAEVKPAALSLQVQALPHTVNQGHQFTFQTVIHNYGSGTGRALHFQQRLPLASRAHFIKVTSSQGSCRGSGPIDCQLGPLAPGAKATITVTLRAQALGRVYTYAVVHTPTPDLQIYPTAVNALAYISGPRADLNLKFTAPAKVTQGAYVALTAQIHNSGPAIASNVHLQTLLPGADQASFVSVNAAKGTCSGTGPIDCQLGPLAANATVTVTVTIQAKQAGALRPSAWVSSSTRDNHPANNYQLTTTTVAAP